MPTADTFTYSGKKLEPVQAPEMARTMSALFPASTTIPRGTLLGELSASPGTYAAYDHTAVNGLGVLKGITVYDITTDSDGKITSVAGLVWSHNLSMPIYYCGFFACEDIANDTELDDAIAAGQARLVQGTTTTGVFALGL